MFSVSIVQLTQMKYENCCTYSLFRYHLLISLSGILCVYAIRSIYIRASSGSNLNTARQEDGCVYN
jgi:hypothetical protein